jgi:hypothetical protein
MNRTQHFNSKCAPITIYYNTIWLTDIISKNLDISLNNFPAFLKVSMVSIMKSNRNDSMLSTNTYFWASG